MAGEDPAVQDTTSQPQEPARSPPPAEKQTGLTPPARSSFPPSWSVSSDRRHRNLVNHKMFTYDPGLLVAGKSVRPRDAGS